MAFIVRPNNIHVNNYTWSFTEADLRSLVEVGSRLTLENTQKQLKLSSLKSRQSK